MGKVKNFIFCAAFCLFFPSTLFSETILLKSGQKVEGKILEKTDKYVKLEFQGVELVYYNDEIVSIGQADPGSANAENRQQAEEQPVQASQVTPAVEPAPDLSQLPSEYQKMVQSALQSTQGAQAGQAGTGVPAEADLSKLPPEYQDMLKEVVAKLQAADPNLPEKE